jgi:acetyltransferase
MIFGTGGTLVEVYRDKAIALPPLTITLAKRLMQGTKIYDALKGARGKKPVDLGKLEKVLVNFSNLIAQYPQIKECDINPLLVSEDTILSLDARIILHEKKEKYPKLAIRPYPLEYVSDTRLKDNMKVTIRPIYPDDEPLVREFYKDVSEKSLKEQYFRSLHYDDLIAHERLIRICFIDYDREITLVTELKEENITEIIAIARFTKLKNSKNGFFSLLVKDKYQKKGLGKKLLLNIIKIAKDEKQDYLISQMLQENFAMRNLCKTLGFTLQKDEVKKIIRISLKL